MIDLEIIAQHINLYDLLKKELKLRECNSVGADYRIECPDPFHLDKAPSCFLSKDKLIFQCFGCGAKGTLVDLVSAFMGMSYNEAKDYVERLCSIPVDGVSKQVKGRFVKKERPAFQLSTQYSRDWKNADPSIKEFVERRNFNRDIMEEHFVGYNNYLCSLTIPIIEGRQIVNIAERWIYPPSPAEKFKYMPEGQILYDVWGVVEGYEQEDPYFTEGIFDAWRMREAGYNAYGMINNRLYKAKLRHIVKLFPGRKYTIVPDADQGGTTMIEDWKGMLNEGDVNVVQVQGTKDIDEVPVNRIRNMVESHTVPLQDYLLPTRPNREEVCNTFTKRSTS